MRNLVLQSMSAVAGIGLLCTTPALADPLTVTTGPVTAQPNGGGPFTLAGDGFSLSGTPTLPGYQSGFWACNPCRGAMHSSLTSAAVSWGRSTAPHQEN